MIFHADYRGQGEYLKFNPELKAELQRRGELGLAVSRALAPRLNRATRTRIPGALAASGHVVDDGIGGVHHDRMQLSVVFDVSTPEAYGAAATWPHNRRNPAAADYLRVAIPVIERG